jgi:hypothetical protein
MSRAHGTGSMASAIVPEVLHGHSQASVLERRGLTGMPRHALYASAVLACGFLFACVGARRGCARCA